MYGKPICIVSIGKIKSEYWKKACEHYMALIRKWRKVEFIELKDSSLTPELRIADEGRRLLPALEKNKTVIALTDTGRQYNSLQFAKFIANLDNDFSKAIIFVIGGPYGLSKEVLAQCRHTLSLSLMTWPHELAKVLLLEQIYRAQSILSNVSYHH